MGRVTQKKAEMGYVKRPIWPICGNCAHFTSVVETRSDWYPYTVEHTKRCGLGGFAVNKTATCKRYTPRDKEDCGDAVDE